MHSLNQRLQRTNSDYNISSTSPELRPSDKLNGGNDGEYNKYYNKEYDEEYDEDYDEEYDSETNTKYGSDDFPTKRSPISTQTSNTTNLTDYNNIDFEPNYVSKVSPIDVIFSKNQSHDILSTDDTIKQDGPMNYEDLFYMQADKLVASPEQEHLFSQCTDEEDLFSDDDLQTFQSSLSIETPLPTPKPIDKTNSPSELIYIAMKPLAFVIFMFFWISKEPIIRVVTFFTMIVSNIIVDPLLYLWSLLPHQDSQWLPSAKSRKRFVHWCTGFMLVLLLSAAVKQLYPDFSLLSWYDADRPASNNVHSSQTLNTLRTQLKKLSDAVSKLESLDDRVKKQGEEVSKLRWSLEEQASLTENKLIDTHSIFTQNIKNELAKYEAKVDDKFSLVWSAIEEHHKEMKALQEKINVEIHESIESRLPSNILVHTDKEGSVKISPEFYEHLQEAHSWEHFLEQNKVAIDNYLDGKVSRFLEIKEEQGAIISKSSFMKLLAADLAYRHNTTSAEHNDGNGSPILLELIDSAVAKYHQDVLDTADFALESRGARIIHSKTSPTYQPAKHFKNQLLKFMGLNTLRQNPPEMAIRPQTHAGEAWSMAGNHGTLGILLSEKVMIQSITIEHPSQEVLLGEINSAPQQIEVFGVDKNELTSLGRVFYDIHKNKPIQTFTLSMNPSDSFRAIIVKVKSNWGNNERTDIYRIRVHGVPQK